MLKFKKTYILYLLYSLCNFWFKLFSRVRFVVFHTLLINKKSLKITLINFLKIFYRIYNKFDLKINLLDINL